MMIPVFYLSTDENKKAMLWSGAVDEALKKYNLCWTENPAEAQAIVTTWGCPVVDDAMLEKMPEVRIVGHAAGSVRAIAGDGEAIFRRNITLFSANPLMAEAVAEWSTMAMLMMQRQLPVYAKIRAGEKAAWGRSGELAEWGTRGLIRDIHDTVIGIWGYGDITKAFLKRIRAFEPKEILVFSGHADEAELAAAGAVKVGSFEELLKRCHQLHCLTGQTPQNLGMLNAGTLALMQDGASVINGGRPGLMDYDALAAECRNGRLSAMVDVLPDEKAGADSPLYGLDNTVVTPHSAAWTGRMRYVPWVLKQIRNCFDGKPVEGAVSPARFGTMTDEKLRNKK